MTNSAVLFDLDGTLIDTTHLHTLAWWLALGEADVRVPMASIHALIGMGGTELVTALLGHDDDAVRNAHARHFESLRERVGATALPGACELLRATRAAGVAVVIVTSSKPKDVAALLPAVGGRDAIDDLVHGEESDRAKPEPDLFHIALERTGVAPSDALAIGDAEWDVRAANAAGIAAVGVLTGGTPADRLLQAGAIAIYRSCQEILDQWATSPLARAAK